MKLGTGVRGRDLGLSKCLLVQPMTHFDEFLTSSEGQHGQVVDHGVITDEKDVLEEKCADKD